MPTKVRGNQKTKPSTSNLKTLKNTGFNSTQYLLHTNQTNTIFSVTTDKSISSKKWEFCFFFRLIVKTYPLSIIFIFENTRLQHFTNAIAYAIIEKKHVKEQLKSKKSRMCYVISCYFWHKKLLYLLLSDIKILTLNHSSKLTTFWNKVQQTTHSSIWSISSKFYRDKALDIILSYCKNISTIYFLKTQNSKHFAL